MATWPVSLPAAPLLGGIEAEDQDNVIRFEPDVGEAMARQRSTAVPVRMTVEFKLTEAQRATLMAFYRTDCAYGSVEFTWTDPEDGETASFMFLGSPKRGHQTKGAWRVSCTLLRLP